MAYNCRKFYKRKKFFLVICCFVLPLYFLYSHSLVKEGPQSLKKTCSCETCISDRGISRWFDVRFNSSIQPQLTRRNENIPQDILLWWLGLQSRHPRLSMMYSRLFEVMPKFNPIKNGHSCNCRRCAIVGNSGNLKGSNYGQLIDSQDYVIRMNRAVTKGHESDVGKKTTHHFMYPESAKDLEPNVHLVLVPFKPHDLLWFANVLTNKNFFLTHRKLKGHITADSNKVIIFHPGFFKYVHDEWTEHHGRYPSTGMLALIFGLHICDQLLVFGYGGDRNGNWHHYWENNRLGGAFRVTGVHNATFEMNIITRLAEIGKIQLYRGTPAAS
ncbi:CMP-N-acetylneuraminate-beta-galactosamide-alpha-2,3-sialyltransferase 2-like [Rhincodon typus]|uniref:CMP-N-acetylneuraminate-beta-galactosamide- alpha-2,3-sialyltransferase 2-like n=1 Tax=Rhincodon typus TaxID=259920 RepID=UPI0009A3E7DB|nr:CMP-N-acetylneuraminate-beta-galactosamide-alpha-2,3-sialyltransferase 2-like [Rhincodon typus]XP_048464110.1 CMP-N-acetylneuraminate-beta-galactosamide-alpha-2,3-sialyltransferase 2-like [Rhincodon typus]